MSFSEGGVLWNGNLYRELTFSPCSCEASFSLDDVTIGVNFHWQRQETQTFQGTLKLVVEADKVCAINSLPVEDYLVSVISSEMKATSSLEFLKAHAVISRSWLLAQMERRRRQDTGGSGFFSFVKKDDEQFATSKELLRDILKAVIANDLFNTSTYFQVINKRNDIFQEALKIINDEQRYEAILKHGNAAEQSPEKQ